MTSPVIRVAAKGDGVTADGRHVPIAAPGDMVDDDGRVTPGPHHQTPPCRHFPACGGCQLQHLDDAAYARFVEERVAGALAAQGLETAILPAILSPPNSRRRAVFQVERKGKSVRLGFNEAASHAIVDIAECPVLAPPLFGLVEPLRALLASQLPDRGRARVHVTLADQGVDVLVEGKLVDDLAAAEALAAFCLSHRIARFAVDDGMGPQTRWEPDAVTVTLGDTPVPFPHASFLQPTCEGEAALVAAVRGAIGNAGTTADLFAGLGTFALSLPGKVYAAEGARDAVLALKAGATRSHRPVFAEHRDLFRRPLEKHDLDRFDAVVLDPPRAGAHEQAVRLSQGSVPVIAYVSCNPSTFARDAKTICEGGYRLVEVQPVGQFRWSTHVELVATFRR